MKKKINEKELTKELTIPESFNLEINGNEIIIKKDTKKIVRKIPPEVKISKEGNKICLKINSLKKKDKKQLGTIEGHIKNMIAGLEKPFEYELEVCNVHFPMTVEYNKSKGEFAIKNMLGEKTPRVLKIMFPEDIEVKITHPKIFIYSFDIEKAGQVVSGLESVSKVKYRDRNKFQDGIFLIKKPGRVYL